MKYWLSYHKPPLFWKKCTFSHSKSQGTKFDLEKKGSRSTLVTIWTNLVELGHLVLHTKFQGNQPSGSGEDVKRFLPYMGMRAMLVMWPYLKFPYCQDATYEITVSEEKLFENVDHHSILANLGQDHWMTLTFGIQIGSWSPYMSMVAILVIRPVPLNKFSINHCQEAANETWLKLAQQFQWRSHLKILINIQS